MINYVDKLRAHNLKVTPQRVAIATILHERGHVTIDTLYEIMAKEFVTISLATIYKNINIMLESIFIQEVKISQTKSLYELTKEPHAHLVCQECSSIEDIDFDAELIVNQISNIGDFKVKSTSLLFTGICKKCTLAN